MVTHLWGPAGTPLTTSNQSGKVEAGGQLVALADDVLLALHRRREGSRSDDLSGAGRH
jgi:hypothetical protein